MRAASGDFSGPRRRGASARSPQPRLEVHCPRAARPSCRRPRGSTRADARRSLPADRAHRQRRPRACLSRRAGRAAEGVRDQGAAAGGPGRPRVATAGPARHAASRAVALRLARAPRRRARQRRRDGDRQPDPRRRGPRLIAAAHVRSTAVGPRAGGPPADRCGAGRAARGRRHVRRAQAAQRVPRAQQRRRHPGAPARRRYQPPQRHHRERRVHGPRVGRRRGARRLRRHLQPRLARLRDVDRAGAVLRRPGAGRPDAPLQAAAAAAQHRPGRRHSAASRGHAAARARQEPARPARHPRLPCGRAEHWQHRRGRCCAAADLRRRPGRRHAHARR